jgi:hypothetical protein
MLLALVFLLLWLHSPALWSFLKLLLDEEVGGGFTILPSLIKNAF